MEEEILNGAVLDGRYESAKGWGTGARPNAPGHHISGVILSKAFREELATIKLRIRDGVSCSSIVVSTFFTSAAKTESESCNISVPRVAYV